MSYKRPFLGKILRQIGEIWTHLKELDLKRKQPKVSKHSHALTSIHTEAMATMLDFFFYNVISPKEKLSPTGRTIEAKLLKRINAVIAIMRDVEKTQTKPTVVMLSALFEQTEPDEKKLILEKNRREEMGQVRCREKDVVINNTQK